MSSMRELYVRWTIRQALDKYNIRVAKYLQDYMGWPYEEILAHINSMDDNKLKEVKWFKPNKEPKKPLRQYWSVTQTTIKK